MPVVATTPLGTSGPTIPRVGLGLMGFHFLYGPPTPDEQCFALLDRAIEIGETFWDTSDVYGGSEEMLGRYFKARPGAREKVFLATKFACQVKDGNWVIRTDREYVFEACEASLKKLGIEYIDLYYMHRVVPSVPIEETVQAMAELKQAGKVRHLGLSEVSSATLRRAHAVHPIAAVQQEYSLFTLDIEDPSIALLSTCRELGVALVAYSPLSRGLLTGEITKPSDFDETDLRRFLPRWQPENFDKNLELVAEFRNFAEKKGCSLSQLALAWLLAQGEDIFVIPGTKRVKYLESNFGAGEVKLTEEEEKVLRGFVEKAKPSGDRYGGVGGVLFGDTVELKKD